jgi:hypothetical protein
MILPLLPPNIEENLTADEKSFLNQREILEEILIWVIKFGELFRDA